MLECQKLNRNIPRLKWCVPVLSAVTRLMDSAIEYTAQHFHKLLSSSKFIDIDRVSIDMYSEASLIQIIQLSGHMFWNQLWLYI